MQPQGRLGPGVARCVCGWLGEQQAWRRAAAVGMLVFAGDGLRARWAAYGLLGLGGLVSVCRGRGGRGGQEWRRRMTLASEWLCSFARECLAAWRHGGMAVWRPVLLGHCDKGCRRSPRRCSQRPMASELAGLGWPRRGSLVRPAATASLSAEMMRRGHWGQERWKGGTTLGRR
jgi:hypothetical protein